MRKTQEFYSTYRYNEVPKTTLATTAADRYSQFILNIQRKTTLKHEPATKTYIRRFNYYDQTRRAHDKISVARLAVYNSYPGLQRHRTHFLDNVLNMGLQPQDKQPIVLDVNGLLVERGIRNQQERWEKEINQPYRFKTHYILREFFDKARNFLDNNDVDKSYKEYRIPKKKRGPNGEVKYRKLAEPSPELQSVQRLAAMCFEKVFRVQPHNSVHSYVKKRSATTNAEMHRFSRFTLSMDIKDFFPSTTPKILFEELTKIDTFVSAKFISSTLDENTKKELSFRDWVLMNKTHNNEYQDNLVVTDQIFLAFNIRRFLDYLMLIAFYKGSLPQGSSLSPLLSNLVLLPFDATIEKILQSRGKPRIIYTRYADDITLSSTHSNVLERIKGSEFFNFQYESEVAAVLHQTGYRLHTEKTHANTVYRRNYITGVKINKTDNISYGHERKETMKRDLFHALMKHKKGQLTHNEAEIVLGRLSYMRSIEPKYTDDIIKKYTNSFNINPKELYRTLLNN